MSGTVRFAGDRGEMSEEDVCVCELVSETIIYTLHPGLKHNRAREFLLVL